MVNRCFVYDSASARISPALRRMTVSIWRNLAILVLRIAVVVVLAASGWFIYRQLPATPSQVTSDNFKTSVQIILRSGADVFPTSVDVPIDLYPVDMVAVRDEFFTDPRPGKRFDDFLKDRMKGRSRVSTHLDSHGQGTVELTPGSWWLHAKMSGDEEVEWRLPLKITGEKQVIELTQQNAYTRSKSF